MLPLPRSRSRWTPPSPLHPPLSGWGKFEQGIDIKGLVDKTNRSDLWTTAAKTLGLTNVVSGAMRGKETFFDGKVFDPENPAAYLKSLSIKRIEV